MSWIEDYQLWKDNEKTGSTSFPKIQFFKTKPTIEQLKILDRRDKRIYALFLFLMLFYFVVGYALGYGAGMNG